jgi:hypothetical protein
VKTRAKLEMRIKNSPFMVTTLQIMGSRPHRLPPVIA